MAHINGRKHPGSLYQAAKKEKLALLTDDRGIFAPLSVRDNLRLGRGGVEDALAFDPGSPAYLDTRGCLLLDLGHGRADSGQTWQLRVGQRGERLDLSLDRIGNPGLPEGPVEVHANGQRGVFDFQEGAVRDARRSGENKNGLPRWRSHSATRVSPATAPPTTPKALEKVPTSTSTLPCRWK